jgi:hypothetical protein
MADSELVIAVILDGDEVVSLLVAGNHERKKSRRG